MSTTSAEQHSNGGTHPDPSGPLDLLGRPGQAGLPLWLNPSIFTSEGFDSDACVADLRRFVSSLLYCTHSKQGNSGSEWGRSLRAHCRCPSAPCKQSCRTTWQH
jgi:hypothetical protein